MRTLKAGFFRNQILLQGAGISRTPNPQPGGPVTTISLASTLWPACQGRTYWGDTPDGKALKVTEASKLPHHDKVVVYGEGLFAVAT